MQISNMERRFFHILQKYREHVFTGKLIFLPSLYFYLAILSKKWRNEMFFTDDFCERRASYDFKADECRHWTAVFQTQISKFLSFKMI